ncbi:cilia- and flagella-associated protein 100-like [Trematomus bernacchii]|uniref:cilia- and flagella-associated protein 100-like n=1 Tax=Trematomus bernacchii TaxID=40690 RepID=UPI001469A0E9|nr:cilia- and flagella-associated protein 100-like [Trematomus bernacchii]
MDKMWQKTVLNEQETESDEEEYNELRRKDYEESLKTGRSKAKKLTEACLKKRVQVKLVEYDFIEVNYLSEQYQKKFEETSENARIFSERQGKAKQEMYSTNEELTDQIRTNTREPPMFDEIRPEYNRYLNILLKRPPSEWQEALRTTDLREPARVQGSERGLDSSAGGVSPPPPPHTDTLVTDGNVDGDSSQSEDKLELSPHQILDLVTELTDQVLSLTRNSYGVDEPPLKELMQDIETISRKMEEDDEKLTLQLDEMKDRIVSDLERAATLKKKVQLHDSKDHDTMSDALGVKITEVYRCCVDSHPTDLSTLEKLTSVEHRISLLFQFLESIPKENLKTLRLIKDSVRRGRLREEQLRLEKEKCKQRLMDRKKQTGRQLRPRCFPVQKKIPVSEEDNIPAEKELHAFLFTENDG